MPARACPRVLGARAAGTTGFCSQMQLPFVPAPLAAAVRQTRTSQTRTSRSKAAGEAEQRSHRRRSQPADGNFPARDVEGFHQCFNTIFPPLQQQRLHFTAVETEATKAQKGEESQGASLGCSL